MSKLSRGTAPCIVLGLETQIGLGIVRELGRAGVRVVGIAHQESAIGLRSKYLCERIVVRQPRSTELLEAILSIGRRYGRCPLLTISEANLLWLVKHRQVLESVIPVLPDARAFATVLDKRATLAAAETLGIETPPSWQPEATDDFAAQAKRLPFPAVLKWSDQNEVAPLLAANGLMMLKAEYVNSAAELHSALDRYSRIQRWPLVQGYCAGYGLGQFFYIQHGRAVRRFQHRRIAEWPPEGGFSSVCDAVPLVEHVELQERSIELLLRIGWTGAAMVEYRFDPKLGRARLMEINGRFWGSFPLAYYSGAAFALLSYLDALGEPLEGLPEPRADLRCRMISTEIKRLVRVVAQPGKIADRSFPRRPAYELARFFLDFFRPRVRYYVWSSDDPRPFFADLRNVVRRLEPTIAVAAPG